MKKFRVVIRKKSDGPDRWGVQELAGYTDGKHSWRLATTEPFYSKASAQAWIQARESPPAAATSKPSTRDESSS